MLQHSHALDQMVRAIGASPFLPFVRGCFAASPYVTTVHQLRGSASATSLITRFFRRELPSPKQYLLNARLVRVRAILDDANRTFADACLSMGYSSPAAFHRHVHQYRGGNASTWRAASTVESELAHYVETLIIPYTHTLRHFDPYAPTPDHRARHANRRREALAA